MRDIGSDFWQVEIGNNNNNFYLEDRTYFMLSGRTALDYIIRDIKIYRKLDCVYLPSYCCHTIIEPFINNDVRISFYSVLISDNNGFSFNINYDMDFDAIVIMQYFGYSDEDTSKIKRRLQPLNKVVIEDITHSFFNNYEYGKYIDYAFGSLRKWTGLYSGGIAVKIKTNFILEKPNRTNNVYYILKKNAMKLKKEYIYNQISNKGQFRQLYSDAENLLSYDYKDYLIDNDSYKYLKKLEIDYMKKVRLENAIALVNNINKNPIVQFIYSIDSESVPLYVPIIVNNGLRDKLKDYLIKRDIYCPIHWPLTSMHTLSENEMFLYENTLSLVCDQRYNLDDIMNVCNKIKKFICMFS